MNFICNLGKIFAMSAAATLGVVSVLGIWSSGLENVLMSKTEKLFVKKDEKDKAMN